MAVNAQPRVSLDPGGRSFSSATPTSAPSTSWPRPSQDRISKQNSGAGISGLARSPEIGMDGAADGLPRHRSSLNHARRAGRSNTKSERSSGLPSGRLEGHDNVHEADELKHSVFSSDEEPRSGSSSRTTSEDVELDRLASEDGLTDDEETGLTKGDRRRRRRRKRRHTLMDERIAEGAEPEKQERTLADKSIIGRLLVNAVLIGLWLVNPPMSDVK